MIILENGHWRSIKTDDEESATLKAQLAELDPETRACVEAMLADYLSVGSSKVADAAAEALWETIPVPIEEWLDNPDLAGEAAASLHPILREDMIELFQEPFFSDRYHEIIFTGALGTGKSQAGGSLVQSSRGLMEIQELMEGDLDFCLHAESGPRRATYRENEGPKRAIKLTLHSGSWVESTPHHRYRVLSPSFEIVWKRADQIQRGDYLVKKPGADLWGTRSEIMGLPLTEELAQIIGLWVAEGWYTDGKQVLMCNGEGREINERLLSGCEYHWIRYERGCDYFAIEGPLAEVIRETCETGAGNKTIPRFIREAPKNVMCAFLRGYYGGDGHVGQAGAGGYIEIVTKSRRLANQNQHILWALGIRSRVTPKIVADKTYWRLNITHKWSKIKFRDLIGVCYERKKTALEGICDERVHHRDNDRDEDLWFDSVVDIESNRETPMYDFTVDGDPSYVANGVISHNTFWTSLAIERICYELLCMKCPQTALGLAPSDPLYVIPVSRTKELARRVAFGQIAGKMNLSPFFRKRMRETKEEVSFPAKNLFIMGGSSNESHALGMNVVAAFVDEASFFGTCLSGDSLVWISNYSKDNGLRDGNRISGVNSRPLSDSFTTLSLRGDRLVEADAL